MKSGWSTRWNHEEHSVTIQCGFDKGLCVDGVGSDGKSSALYITHDWIEVGCLTGSVCSFVPVAIIDVNVCPSVCAARHLCSVYCQLPPFVWCYCKGHIDSWHGT